MLVVISPAKKLNICDQAPRPYSKPEFEQEIEELLKVARELSPDALRKLMKISENLADLNAERFAAFGTQPKMAAMFMFAGDTYQGLEAQTLDEDSLRWAQDHLRILSGLYGVLRPFDAMEAYRLEMGSRLQTLKGKNLYAFWEDKIAQALGRQARAQNARYLVNCASQEYFGAVNVKALGIPVITPVFKERRGSQTKIISFYAKKARGAMARFIVENRIETAKDLRDFDSGGYLFEPTLSNESELIYIRNATD